MTLVAMPPEPTSDAEPPAIASISGVMRVTSGMNVAAGSSSGRPCTGRRRPRAARGSRRSPSAPRARRAGRCRRSGSRGGDRVVLVDHGDRAEPEQRLERIARVEVTAALLGVAERHEHLRDRETVLLGTSFQACASRIWPTAAAAWLSSSLSRPDASPSSRRPSAIAPEETSTTSWPRARSADVGRKRLEPRTVHVTRRSLDEQCEPTTTTLRARARREPARDAEESLMQSRTGRPRAPSAPRRPRGRPPCASRRAAANA